MAERPTDLRQTDRWGWRPDGNGGWEWWAQDPTSYEWYKVPSGVFGGIGTSLNFEAVGHLTYSLDLAEGSEDTVVLSPRNGQWNTGDHLLLTEQGSAPDGWYIVNDDEAQTATRVTDPDPYDGTHNGDSIWAYRRYATTGDEGSGPWHYGVYSTSDVTCGLVLLSAPPDMRPSTATANVILMAPSENPEPGDLIWTVFYDSSIREVTPENVEEGRPWMPREYTLMFSEEWTGVWPNTIKAKVALMCPGDIEPRGLYYVTPQGFQRIEMNAGTSVSVFCMNIQAGFAGRRGPMRFTAIGGEDWFFGGPDGRASYSSLTPDFTTTGNVVMDGTNHEGPLADLDDPLLNLALDAIDNALVTAVRPVWPVEAIGYRGYGRITATAQHRDPGATTLATVLGEVDQVAYDSPTDTPFNSAGFNAGDWNVGMTFKCLDALHSGDQIRGATFRYSTDGANSSVDVAALLCDGSQAAQNGTGTDVLAADATVDGRALAHYTGWVNPEGTLTVMLTNPIYVNNNDDVQLQVRFKNGDSQEFTVNITEVTFLVDRDGYGFLAQKGAFSEQTVNIADFNPGSNILVDTDGVWQIAVIDTGVWPDALQPVRSGTYIVRGNYGTGLAFVVYTDGDGQFLNDNPLRDLGLVTVRPGRARQDFVITDSEDTDPDTQISMILDGDGPYTTVITFNDTLADFRYPLSLQVWRVEGGVVSTFGDFAVLGANQIGLAGAEIGDNIRVGGLFYFND